MTSRQPPNGSVASHRFRTFRPKESFAPRCASDLLPLLLQGLTIEPVSYTHLDVYKRQLAHLLRERSPTGKCRDKRSKEYTSDHLFLPFNARNTRI